MHIGVTTPTGTVGRHLVRALVRAGVRPVLLLRDPAKVEPDLVELVETRVIDQYDVGSTVEATHGLDAVYWVDPTAGAEDPLAATALATEAVVAAIRANGIARVAFQSSIGAELRHGAGEIDGLAATEVALDATEAAVLHLRCGYFFSNLLIDPEALLGGTLTTLHPVDSTLPWVAPRDIADVAAGRLLAGWSGRVVQAVHGPADLGWSEVAAIVSAATGVPLVARRIGDEEQRAALLAAGLATARVDSIVGMSVGLRDGFTPEQARDVTSTTPTTLAAWAYDVLRPRLAGYADRRDPPH